MPKIKAELEVPEEYCDARGNICPMWRCDGIIDFCMLFHYALEEDPDNGYSLKRLNVCKKAEVKNAEDKS